MKRIDFYVQHLVRHNAVGILVRSGRPVTFQFPDGDKSSPKAILHAQLVQLVQEAAPPSSLEELKRRGSTTFLHQSSTGIDVDCAVEVAAPDRWQLAIRQSAPGASPRAPEAQAAPAAAPAQLPSAPRVRPSSEIPSTDGLPGAAVPRHATVAVQPAEESIAGRVRASMAPPLHKAPSQVSLSGGEPRINRYLRMMVEVGASDLHMSADVTPMVRVSGDMEPLEKKAGLLSSQQLFDLFNEIMPERNRREFQETWDTDFAHTIEGLSRFRANLFMDRKGVGAVFRQIPFEILSHEKLGLPPKVLDLCWLTKGLVLVTGPTGSGKSTTLATLVDYVNQNRADHIITIEDPVEFVHPNKKCLVNQREVGTHTKTFKAALRAALREDPDIVLVGEMRDLETISIAIETAETGHLVFGTLHTTSAISTIDRIIDQFPPEQQSQIRVMLSESLRGVIAQVLCKKIGGGRVAGYEVLISNPACANLIREGKTHQLTSIMQTGGKLGMQTMNDNLVEHVKKGRITPEEAYIKSNDKSSMMHKFQMSGITLNLTT